MKKVAELVVAGSSGIAVPTSDLVANKTVIATGVSGKVFIEASADGVNFWVVGSMTASTGTLGITVAASHMRVVPEDGLSKASSVSVVAEQGRIRAGVIPSRRTFNEPDRSIDVSSFGSLTTFYVGQLREVPSGDSLSSATPDVTALSLGRPPRIDEGDGPPSRIPPVNPGDSTFHPNAAIELQISGDDVNWATFEVIKHEGLITTDVSARYLRAVSHGLTGVIQFASADPAERAINSPAPAFVFRPGGIEGGNVYTRWPHLVDAMSSVQGRKVLEFDDSMMPETQRFCEIPQGVWNMKDVAWSGYGPRSSPSAFRTFVDIADGAVFENLRMIGGQITVRNRANTISPVSDFGPGNNQVHIGLRDDCGNAQFQNLGTAPMFAIGSNTVTFFVQNTLFGIGSATPIIEQAAPPVNGVALCTINLLGQNQTGENLVRGAAGASVNFAILSSSASIGANQSSITSPGGSYSISPLGRIQRELVPRGSADTTSQIIKSPNALVQCDGNSGFTQLLPQIVGGFKILTQVMYTGGQEIVVAEVAGGSALQVAADRGDTIDGGTDPVAIAPRGSRTFVSDGISNWITIGIVP